VCQKERGDHIKTILLVITGNIVGHNELCDHHLSNVVRFFSKGLKGHISIYNMDLCCTPYPKCTTFCSGHVSFIGSIDQIFWHNSNMKIKIT
jgi:hypothetical protein